MYILVFVDGLGDPYIGIGSILAALLTVRGKTTLKKKIPVVPSLS
jgi:hypothetical protein